MEEIKAQIETIDGLIKEARWKEATALFRPFENRKFPRELLLDLSHLARRLNRPLQILKWLHPYMRPEQANIEPVTASEASIYSIGLARIGAYREAKDILMALPQNSAEVQLGLVQMNGFQWKYPEMIRPLKRYMKLLDPQSYPYHIAELNMLTALLYVEDWRQMEELAVRLLETASKKKHTLLKANILETYAQSKISQRDFEAAGDLLNEAGTILKDSGSRYDMFIKKWKMIIEIMRSEIDLRAEIQGLQKQAQSESNFETVRELDFYYAVARRDEELFRKVYHGTRFPAYRKKIKQKYGNMTNLHFDRRISFVVDPRIEEMSTFNPEVLDLSSSAREMLHILLSDFYRPIQLGEVFRDLYPKEYFNPNTSRDRLYKVFSRLKVDLQTQATPIDISWQGSHIIWTKRENFHLILQGPARSKAAQEIEHQKLGDRFSIHDFMKIQGKSRRTCERRLDQMVKNGSVKRLKPGLFQKKVA